MGRGRERGRVCVLNLPFWLDAKKRAGLIGLDTKKTGTAKHRLDGKGGGGGGGGGVQ